jgi:hypothetical protein
MSLVAENLAGVRGRNNGEPIYSYKSHSCNPYLHVIRCLTSRFAGDSRRLRKNYTSSASVDLAGQ